MSYDLALSDNGDLIMTAHRDLAGVSGTALIEQRIKLRLRLHRGEWLFDTTKTLGSQLFTLSGVPADKAVSYIDSYVREALSEMTEISVVDVGIDQTAHDVTLVVTYQQELTQEDDTIPADQGLQELEITLPLIPANE